MQGQSEICIFGFGVFLLWFAIEKPLWLKLWCLCSYEAKLKKKRLISSFNEFQVNIRSIDEAVVIGAALSLSSSAFVLQVV